LFTASAIQISYCDNPGCRAVHLHLLDKEGIARAQAVIGCDDLVAVADTLRRQGRIGCH
jgi:hypothetical protein